MRSGRAGLLLAVLLTGCHADGETPAATARSGVHETGGRAAPQRIVTLAPHLAELVHAAGAGERLVGVSAYSDFPAAVASLPVVGDAFAIDRERLAQLAPDLLLAWDSGTPPHVVEELRARGYRIDVIRTRGLDDIGNALRRIGELTGERAAAAAAAARFAASLEALDEAWRTAAPIRVFYQVSRRPLYTISGDHYISELISLCGGENVFASLSELAPTVSEEAVLARDPEVLLTAGTDADETLSGWKRWPSLAANRYANRFVVPADLAGRATPRVADAGRAICLSLERGRERRAAHSGP